MEGFLEETKSIDLNKLFRFELKFYRILKQILKSTKIFINIPEMLILGFGFKTPTLICSDFRTGEVIIKENLANEAIYACFELFSYDSSPGTPIALWKVLENTNKDRCRLLFTYEECCFNWNFSKSKGTPQVVQKFIRTNPVSILRSEYSLMNKNKTKIYLIKKKLGRVYSKQFVIKKNADRVKFLLLGNDECDNKPISNNHIDNKLMYLVYLIEKYFIKEYNIKVSHLRCNWIEDVNGKVYLLSLKDYKITSNSIQKIRTQTIKLSTTLPALNYVKKLKQANEISKASMVNISVHQKWKDF